MNYWIVIALFFTSTSVFSDDLVMAGMEKDYQSPVKVDMKGGRAIRGSLSAPIKLIEYSDFQCPYCKKGFDTVETLRKKYKNKIVFMFKHLPLPMHPMALPAAKRFEAIALHDTKKAYAFHDKVFQEQSRLGSDGEAGLDQIAKELKVNIDKMHKDMESTAVAKRLEADKAEAAKLEFSGTPGFVVAGVRVRGAMDAAIFEKIIDRRLADPKH